MRLWFTFDNIWCVLINIKCTDLAILMNIRSFKNLECNTGNAKKSRSNKQIEDKIVICYSQYVFNVVISKVKQQSLCDLQNIF